MCKYNFNPKPNNVHECWEECECNSCTEKRGEVERLSGCTSVKGSTMAVHHSIQPDKTPPASQEISLEELEKRIVDYLLEHKKALVIDLPDVFGVPPRRVWVALKHLKEVGFIKDTDETIKAEGRKDVLVEVQNIITAMILPLDLIVMRTTHTEASHRIAKYQVGILRRLSRELKGGSDE